jgi:hypothetical protein
MDKIQDVEPDMEDDIILDSTFRRVVVITAWQLNSGGAIIALP